MTDSPEEGREITARSLTHPPIKKPKSVGLTDQERPGEPAMTNAWAL